MVGSGSAETGGNEPIEAFRIGRDLEMAVGVAAHIECRAEEISSGGEEMWGTGDPTGDTLGVISEDMSRVTEVHREVVLGGQATEHFVVTDVHSVFEDEIA